MPWRLAATVFPDGQANFGGIAPDLEHVFTNVSFSLPETFNHQRGGFNSDNAVRIWSRISD